MRILRLPQVIEKVGYCGMHIGRLEKAGRFPLRVKLGPNSVGWIAEEIEEWIAARVAERDRAQRAESHPLDRKIAP